MLKKESELLKGSIPYAIERDRQMLNKMYEDIELENKYVLFLVFDLCWQYSHRKITGTLKIHTHEGKIELPKVKVRHIYPNKDYFTCCLQKGKTICDMGVPLLFDSFQELSNIKQIECRWEIKTEEMDVYFQVIYDVEFDRKQGRRIYALNSREADIRYLCSKDSKDSTFRGIRKFDEYERVVHIRNSPEKEKFAFKIVKDAQGLMSQNDVKTLVFDNVSKWEYKENPDKIFSIDYYYSKECLQPSVTSGMLI